MERFLTRVRWFRNQVFSRRRELFDKLAQGQSPEALFVTCSDSRIDPSLILGADPGDIFVLRNAGAIVPPYDVGETSVNSAVEFAIEGLNVPHIVCCGHTGCAAIGGMLLPDRLASLPAMAAFVARANTPFDEKTREEAAAQNGAPLTAVQRHVATQVANLQTHPAVTKALSFGRLQVHGWIYHLETGDVTVLDQTSGGFLTLDDAYPSPSPPSLV